MTCPPRRSAGSIGAAVLLAAATAIAAQPPSAEQRAFDAVDRTIAGLESAGGRHELILAARGVLDAAENALSAFDAPDRVRDATYARYLAALREVDLLAVRCDNGYPCDTDERGNTGVVYFDGLVDAYARVWEARSGLSAANAAYVAAVGIAGAAEARERAARFRRYAKRMRRLRGNSNHMLARQRVLIRASNAENDSLNALHDRAIAAHVAANHSAIDELARAARALSTAAERLTDGSHPGAAEVSRAAGRAESAVAAAADPAVSYDGNRTDAVLDELIGAARETVAALESHVRPGACAGERSEAEFRDARSWSDLTTNTAHAGRSSSRRCYAGGQPRATGAARATKRAWPEDPCSEVSTRLAASDSW